MSLRRTLALALLCALPIAHACAAGPAAAPTVKWVLPWKAGTTLEYAYEDLTTKDLDKRERTRSTSIATVRIPQVLEKGFLQAWSWRDNVYVVEEGDKAEEAAMRKYAAALQDLVLEVQLDAEGSYGGLRNLDRITPRLRQALLPAITAGMDEKLAAISDQGKREEARKAGQAQAEAFLDRMLAPAVMEALLARNIQWFNAFTGIDIEPDQEYEAKLELPSPVGGPAIPVTVVFSLSVSEEDPDDIYVEFRQAIDRENAGTALSAIAESLFGMKLPSGKDAPEISIVDDGLFVVHRPTGVPEMFESTRTLKVGERSKVERHRMRLLNGVHEHVWKDEAPPAATTTETRLAASARARLSAVGASGAGGDLAFNIDNGGVRVTGTLTGVEPGSAHGFHVHEFGDCGAADASSAGGHFNPTGQAHGDRRAGGAHHAGDMPNQVAGDDGRARVDQLLAGLEIGSGSARDLIGKSVIVHAKADDYRSQPSGDAGGRIACGVIELENAPPADGGPAD